MIFNSTRNNKLKVDISEAILNCLSNDGGLFVPEKFPKIDLSSLNNMGYKEAAFFILKEFFCDYSADDLKYFINEAYSTFSNNDVISIKELDDRNFIELYYGRTLAFKDVALSILPYFINLANKKINNEKEIIILTATSGDTGKATLEAFKNKKNIKVVVLYPQDGVSYVQKLQMMAQEGNNIFVFGIDGNFDDAQNLVKEIFENNTLKENFLKKDKQFCSANSINIGRLLPQIVYYIYSYLCLVNRNKIKCGDKINVCVPTGNFGNILAAYYSKKMGLPIDKLICASNANNVLTDFFNIKIYDRKREFHKTTSPSMDILVSSNLERYIYDISGRNDDLVKNLMYSLKKDGKYKLDYVFNDFYANYASEEEVDYEINRVFTRYNYLIDPHTAVASNVYNKYIHDTGDNKPVLIASTSSPYKFPKEVLKALKKCVYDNEFENIKLLSKLSNTEIPEVIKSLFSKKIIHNKTIKKENLIDILKEI